MSISPLAFLPLVLFLLLALALLSMNRIELELGSEPALKTD